jgi:large subunit ribosomal protein L28
MAKVCALTGKRPRSGNTVSHANNKTKRRFKPNLITKRVWDPAKKRYVKMRISARALKSLDKKAMVK